jgi:pimeloyl-ACP methyl ester carboxylesterase
MRTRTFGVTLAAATLALLLSTTATGGERHVMLSTSESLHVVQAGEGDPVVLIPGLFGSAYGFRRVVPLLAEAGYRAIVVEPLGVGGSARPDSADYSLTAQADRIDRVLDELAVEQALVVAHASGASIALRLAYRHPRRVAEILSLDGGPAETAATPGFRRAMRFAPLLKLFGGLKRIRGAVQSTLVTRSADARWVTEEIVDGYMSAGSRDLDATLSAYRGMARAREPEELKAHLAEIRCPVRLVVGGAPHEGAPSDEEIELLRARLASFGLETVPGVGHFLFEENPPAFIAAVERATTHVAQRDRAGTGPRRAATR